MGRRLEKYYLFCNNAFLSLFTIKFVRYLYTTKYTLSWNKKRLQNKSEIPDLFCWLFCFNLQCSCRKMLQKNDFFRNGVAHTPFGKILFILLHFTTNTL